LIEEGGFQAARALSDGRISQIVEAVAAGIDHDEADIIRRKRLLTILGELDDDEVALLNAYGRTYGRSLGESGEDPWDALNAPEPTHMGSTREELDRENLFEAGNRHLERLGLLARHFPFLKRGEMPEFDPYTGDFKHSLEISALGRLLLKEIGMTTPFDLDEEEQRAGL
jgi:hypothetical protein